jgi:hypoxanthine-DNA glycosylase
MRIHGFPPIAGRGARVLVLGSMPSEASLRAGEYYAHPRNGFWPIMGRLFGFAAELPYGRRVARLRRCHVAVWDVLRSCERRGSLDSEIAEDTVVANDFAGFFAAQPRIEAVFCNGGKAFASYRRHVVPYLPPAAARLPVVRLPSTSPAHAALAMPQKLAAWRAVQIAVEA